MSENTAAKPHHVVLYARVAHTETGALEQQVAWLRQVAADHGWSTPEVITETRTCGISDDALVTICAADVVLVRSWDRLARNLVQLIEAREALLARGVQVVIGGRLLAAPQTEGDLAMLRVLAQPSRSSRVTVLRRSGRQMPYGCQVTRDEVALDDLLIEQIANEIRRMPRSDLSRRFGAGKAAAKVRREAGR